MTKQAGDDTLSTATELIAEQFPRWSHLLVKPAAVSGCDSVTFRFGKTMSIRMPIIEVYIVQVEKEQLRNIHNVVAEYKS